MDVLVIVILVIFVSVLSFSILKRLKTKKEPTYNPQKYFDSVDNITNEIIDGVISPSIGARKMEEESKIYKARSKELFEISKKAQELLSNSKGKKNKEEAEAKAIELYEEVIASNWNASGTWSELISYYMKESKFNDAIRVLEKGLIIFSDNQYVVKSFKTKLITANFKRDISNNPNSKKENEYMKEITPRLSGYELLSLAEEKIKANNGNYSDEIIELLDMAIEKDISNYTQAKIYKLKGNLFLESGNKSKALESFEKAISIHPKIGGTRIIQKIKKEIIH